MASTIGTRVRLDKWLWAARFYKTRSRSSAAIKGSKVTVNGARAKSSHRVSAGDKIQVRKGPYDFSVEIVALAERRGSAENARDLYVEDEASVRLREQTQKRLAADRAATPRGFVGGGRPTKKQRRDLVAFRERHFAPEQLDEDEDSD